MEEVAYDQESGQLLTGSLMDYCLPRADSLSNMHVVSYPVPTKLNPLGAKGAGEAGTVGALPAVINAVLNALAPLGVRDLDMPTSSEKVWRAMRTSASPAPREREGPSP
jgi:aerobic carbon-monoxide dehydrogenase large subunit